jgi:nickel-type superoxide dismutase maturation protease
MSQPLEVVLQGESMWPTFRSGDVLFFDSIAPPEALSVGVVVLAQHPLKADVLMVKRVHQIQENGAVFLVGDQPDPTATEDSHNFGPVSREMVLAKWNGEVKRA